MQKTVISANIINVMTASHERTEKNAETEATQDIPTPKQSIWERIGRFLKKAFDFIEPIVSLVKVAVSVLNAFTRYGTYRQHA